MTSAVRQDVEGYYRRQLLRTAQLQFRSNKRHNNELRRNIRHLERGKRIRERELDQQETRYLDKLIVLFQKRCEIALEKSENEESCSYDANSPVAKLFHGLKEKEQRDEYERTIKAARMNRPRTAPPTCGDRSSFRAPVRGFQTPSPYSKPHIAWGDVSKGEVYKARPPSKQDLKRAENGTAKSDDEYEKNKSRTVKNRCFSASVLETHRRRTSSPILESRVPKQDDIFQDPITENGYTFEDRESIINESDATTMESKQCRPTLRPSSCNERKEPTAIIFVHVYPDDEKKTPCCTQPKCARSSETDEISSNPEVKTEIVKSHLSITDDEYVQDKITDSLCESTKTSTTSKANNPSENLKKKSMAMSATECNSGEIDCGLSSASPGNTKGDGGHQTITALPNGKTDVINTKQKQGIETFLQNRSLSSASPGNGGHHQTITALPNGKTDVKNTQQKQEIETFLHVRGLSSASPANTKGHGNQQTITTLPNGKIEPGVKETRSNQKTMKKQKRPASAVELRRGPYKPNLQTISERQGTMKQRPKTAIPKYGGRSINLQATNTVTPIPPSTSSLSITTSTQNRATTPVGKYERRDRVTATSPSSMSSVPPPQLRSYACPESSSGCGGKVVNENTGQRRVSYPNISHTTHKQRRRPHTAVHYDQIHSKMMKRLLYTHGNHDKRTRLLFARVQSASMKQLSADQSVPTEHTN